MQDVVISYLVEKGRGCEANVRSMIDAIAAELADVKRLAYGGICDSEAAIPPRAYVVPSDTLTRREADRLGIRSTNDFFGGVVPRTPMRTKIMCHHLIEPHAHRPPGWPAEFTEFVRPLVLPGYATFSIGDAMVAGGRLLSIGAVRIKDPLRANGTGQVVVTCARELKRHMDGIDDKTISEHGLVLELNLRETTTLNVGQIAIDGRVMSYFGLQRMTSNNEGLPEYGGSALKCVMGGWDALDFLPMEPVIRRAVTKAIAFDRATAAWPEFMASRRNYDVAIGTDDAGCSRSGVLESSWRAGGASTAEIAALKRFLADPRAKVVTTLAVKEFGRHAPCPPSALVHYWGEDPAVGPMLRYTVVTGVVYQAAEAFAAGLGQ